MGCRAPVVEGAQYDEHSIGDLRQYFDSYPPHGQESREHVDLIGSLWFAVGIGALIFSADAFIMKFTGRRRGAIGPDSRMVMFGVIMLLFGIASILLGLYETMY
jgi:hypothetical protein